MMPFCSDWKHKRPPIIAIIGMVIGGLALAILFAFLFGWIVMLLWNWLMPELFGLPIIDYWQAWGLVLLAHILFKGGHGPRPPVRPHPARGDRNHWRDTLRKEFQKDAADNSPEEGHGDAGNGQ